MNLSFGAVPPSNVYSYCFWRNRGLVGTENLAVPPGYTAVMRYVTLYAGITPGSTTDILIRDGGTAATIVKFHCDDPGGDNYKTWEGHVVFGTGGVIQIVTQSAPVDMSISGYLLYGIAPVSIVGAPIP